MFPLIHLSRLAVTFIKTVNLQHGNLPSHNQATKVDNTLRTSHSGKEVPGTRLVGPRTTQGLFACWNCDGYLHRNLKNCVVCVIEMYGLVLTTNWFPDFLNCLLFRKVYKLSETGPVFHFRWRDKEVIIDLRSNDCFK